MGKKPTVGDTADAVFDAGKAAVGKAVGGARLAVDKLKDIHADTEIKALGLIFKPDLDTSDFRLPRMIRITEPDSKHKRSPFLLGALGHRSAPKGLEIVNIYPDRLAEFGINLFPDAESEFYYVDPGDDRQYIALDEYFGYIRQRRVNELVTLAKALGARHFKVTYKERRKRLTAKKVTANASARGIGKNGNGQWQHTADSDDFTSIAILAEMNCGGGEPVEAPVVYLKNEPEITHLIEMRMADPSDKLSLKKSIELITSSGIKKADAVKIDGALAALKCAGNVSMTSEVQDEARRVLDYEIEF